MSTFKKAKVVMLATNKIETESRIGYYKDTLSLGNSKYDKRLSLFRSIDGTSTPNPQHLYIISDDEIKENNTHFYNPHSGQLHISGNHTDYIAINKNGCKKIIATTDTSLKIDNPNYDIGKLAYITLPQPSQQFIQKYIEEYNRGNIINDVLVEYGIIYEGRSYDLYNPDKLKVNLKNNTITIKKVKDSWNREEILNDIEQAIIQGLDIGQYRDKWIKENL